jgi:hypothetical protein
LSIASKMSKNVKVMKEYSDIFDMAKNNKKNLLFIYRSDYRKLSQR